MQAEQHAYRSLGFNAWTEMGRIAPQRASPAAPWPVSPARLAPTVQGQAGLGGRLSTTPRRDSSCGNRAGWRGRRRQLAAPGCLLPVMPEAWCTAELMPGTSLLLDARARGAGLRLSQGHYHCGEQSQAEGVRHRTSNDRVTQSGCREVARSSRGHLSRSRAAGLRAHPPGQQAQKATRATHDGRNGDEKQWADSIWHPGLAAAAAMPRISPRKWMVPPCTADAASHPC